MIDPDACPFCLIARGDEPADFAKDPVDGHLLDGTSNGCVMIFRPLKPVVEGHLLAVPTAHVMHAADDPAVAAYTMEEAAVYAQLSAGSWNLITSIGAEATQTVFHLHIHLVPRRAGDKLRLPWPR